MKASHFYWLVCFVYVAPHVGPVGALVIGVIYGAIGAFLQVKGK